jgi:hypothetical protein
MKYPRIKSAKAMDDYRLEIVFDNARKKRYDVTPLLEKEMFGPLKNPALFKAVRVEPGGYAVAWDGHMDISEHELWIHGEEVA